MKFGSLPLVLLLPTAALAHSWYPYECCSDRDCYPVALEQVKSTKAAGSFTMARLLAIATPAPPRMAVSTFVGTRMARAS